MEDGRTILSKTVLLKECIIPNILRNWIEELEVQGGMKKNTIKDTFRILEKLTSGRT